MTRLTLRAALAASVSLAPFAAHAQMVPADYLADLEALLTQQGLTLTHDGTEDQGAGLMVRAVTMSGDLDGAILNYSIGDMLISPTIAAGYDLEVMLSDRQSGTISMDVEGIALTALFSVSGQGMFWVGGPEEDRVVEVAYPDITITYEMTAEDVADMPEQNVTVEMQDVGGKYGYALGAGTHKYDFSAGTATLGLNMTPPGGEGLIDFDATYAGLRTMGTMPLLEISESAFSVGAQVQSEVAYDTSATTVVYDVDGATGTVNLTSAAGMFDLSGKDGQLEYGLSGANVSLNVKTSALPIPEITARMADYELRFAIPLAPSDAPQRLGLKLALGDLSVGEELWSMVDPTGTMDRDPGNLLIDITSTARALIDLTSVDENPEAMMGGMPIEVEDVTVDALDLSMAGLELTGSGAARMNNDGMFPMPVGGVDFKLVGVNGLVGKLTELGLLQPAQAMPVQMMLGMFAKPGDLPDTFTSRIEMAEDGSITANGIQLK